MKNIYKIEFSIKNIIMILGLFIGLFLLWKLQIVVFMFFLSFILSSALRPLVEFLKSKGIPRPISVILIYLFTFLFFAFVIYIVGAVVVDQVKFLSDNANEIVTDLVVRITDAFPGAKTALNLGEDENVSEEVAKEVDAFFKTLPSTFSSDALGGAGTTIVSTITNVTAVLFGMVTVLIVSAYMTNSEDKFYQGFLKLIPTKKTKDMTQDIIEKVENKLGSWLIGQVMLMAIIGILTFIGLELPALFFDTTIAKYAIPLAIIAALLESVPNLGPTLSFLIAVVVIIGSNGSFVEIGYVAFLFFIIQQLEAIFIVPIVMKKAIGIDPIVTILGLIAASTLFGIIGAILVLPMIATAQIIIEEVMKKTNYLNSATNK